MSSALRHRNLPQLLLQSREALMRRFRTAAERAGRDGAAVAHPARVAGRRPLEPRQLGERCLISSPSIAGVLLRMHDAGLIARERMDHDLRRVRVSLTAQGRRLASAWRLRSRTATPTSRPCSASSACKGLRRARRHARPPGPPGPGAAADAEDPRRRDAALRRQRAPSAAAR